MLAAKTLIASALLGLASSAMTAPTTLDFEKVDAKTTLLSTTQLYKDLGVSFSGGGFGVASSIAKTDPGDGNFYRGKIDAPNQSPPFYSANRGAVILWDGGTSTEATFVINVKDGFNDDFFLSYSSADFATSGAVKIFSEANGGGDNLGGIDLQLTGQQGCAGFLCNWNDAHSTIANGKIGKSIVITGGNGLFYLDDFKLNLLGDGTHVPEPGGVALSLAALAALAWSRTKRQAI
ncbi:hypothetical protein LNV09_11160 [Paucibacter sp. B2R-40]|uniref:hypothetical protein n=1 Tax=Paucibacter sp. B2R-40 TaxID=2893554 RepID=UPI0021E47C4C|nr:hypothetical protein [Paucibacter sp. B2R-40]MCV2354719.1 hypothetical protein [Paucibacter sp. B2R-40]